MFQEEETVRAKAQKGKGMNTVSVELKVIQPGGSLGLKDRMKKQDLEMSNEQITKDFEYHGKFKGFPQVKAESLKVFKKGSDNQTL